MISDGWSCPNTKKRKEEGIKLLDKLDREYMLWLYERYVSYLFFAAGKFTDSPSDREDLVHDTLLRLMKNIPTLRKLEPNALTGYLYLTVRSVWLDRNQRELPQSEDVLESLTVHDAGESDAAKWDAAVLKDRLDRREWFLLQTKYIVGCTDAEIGGILGCSGASVRMMLTRARRHAKAILEDKEE